MENIIVVTFEVESEAYQAFSDLKANTYNNSYVIPQAAWPKIPAAGSNPLTGSMSGAWPTMTPFWAACWAL